jgi:4-amino-4-deoxy-L-arabinose transferase-like glycosyltransferase
VVNLALGVIAVALAAALYALALQRYRRGRVVASLGLILAAGGVLRLFAGTDLALHPWDERFHALVAKRLLDHPLTPTLYDPPLLPFDYRDWLGNHVWLHKPPLALWTLAAGLKIFGINEIALRLPSLALSTGAVALTWILGRRFFGEGAALLAAFFHSVNGLLIELAAGRRVADHVDALLITLIEAAVVVAAYRTPSPSVGRLAAIGGITGLALLTKSFPALLVPAVWLAWHVDRARPLRTLRELTIIGITMAAVALPWTIYTFTTFPAEAAWEQSYGLRHLTERLEEAPISPWFYVKHAPRFFGELFVVPLVWFLWRGMTGRESRNQDGTLRAQSDWGGIAVYALLPFLVFSLAATKLPAYVAIGAPGLFLIQGAFCAWLLERASRGGGTRQRWYVAVVLLVMAFSMKYTVEAIRPFRSRERHPGWVRSLRALNTAERRGPAVLFNTSRPIEAMFYTPYTAYERIPVESDVEDLQRRGYEVLICQAPDLPPYVHRNPAVTKVDCGEAVAVRE